MNNDPGPAQIVSVSSVPAKGLGDTIYNLTHKEIGGYSLSQLAEKYTEITGKPCGCKERQEALNKLVPYTKTDTERTKEQQNALNKPLVEVSK